MQELKNALELKKRELESLSLKHGLSPLLQLFTVVMPIVLGCGLMICAFAFFALGDQSSQSNGSTQSEAVAFLLGGVVILGFGIQMKRKGDAGDENWKKTKQGLQDSIQTLEKKIMQAAELGKVETELAALSPARFACKTTDELRTLRDSRRALISRVMGKEYAPVDPPSRRLPANTPVRVVGYIPNVTPPAGILVEDEEDLLRSWCLEAATLVKGVDEAKKLASGDSPLYFVDLLLRHYGAVVFRVSEGSLEMISKTLKPELPQAFLDCLKQSGVKANTLVMWVSEITYDEETLEPSMNEGELVSASEAINGLVV